MKKFFSLLLVLCGFQLLINQQIVHADANFSIKKVDSAQQTKEANFYDILAKPKSTTQLTVNITNTEKQENTYQISLYNGITNGQGKITYSLPTKKNPPVPATATTLHQLNPKTQTIKLTANQSKDISIGINMPATQKPGIILGAVNVRKMANNQEKTDNKKKQIINHYNVQIPVVIRTQPSSTAKLKLQLLQVKPGVTNQVKPGILAKLANPTDWVLSPMTVNAKIYQRSNNRLKYSVHTNGNDIAPHSAFNYSIPIGEKKLKPGHYYLDLIAKSGQYTWHFRQNFTISSHQIKQINNNTIQPKKHYWLWLLLLLLLLLIAYIGYRYHQSRKQKKHQA